MIGFSLILVSFALLSLLLNIVLLRQYIAREFERLESVLHAHLDGTEV